MGNYGVLGFYGSFNEKLNSVGTFYSKKDILLEKSVFEYFLGYDKFSVKMSPTIGLSYSDTKYFDHMNVCNNQILYCGIESIVIWIGKGYKNIKGFF